MSSSSFLLSSSNISLSAHCHIFQNNKRATTTAIGDMLFPSPPYLHHSVPALHSCREQFLQCRHPQHVYLGEWNPVCCLQCCPELLCAKYPGVQPSLRRWSVWVCSGSPDTQVLDKCQSVLLLCIVTRLIQALLYLIQLSSRWVLIE